ncbi:MAG: hypothetical protein AAF943_01845 [Pseudomonadota bacterium]
MRILTREFNVKGVFDVPDAATRPALTQVNVSRNAPEMLAYVTLL